MKIYRFLPGLWLLAAGSAAAGDIAFAHARIYPAPEAPPIERGTVLVRDGLIAAVGPSADVKIPDHTTVIDLEGRVLTAGFWNSHVHFLTLPLRDARRTPAPELEQALRSMLTRWGFTTVFDLASVNGSGAALRRRIEAGEVSGPAILTVDAPFFPEDGMPVYVRDLFEAIDAPSAEVRSAEEGRDRARRQIASGADGVKLFAGAIVGGEVGVLPMDVDIARAIVEEAHNARKPAFAHPTDMRGLDVSLASGVDVLAHTTPFAGPWDATLIDRLRAADIALTPTLTLFEHELRKEDAPESVIERFRLHSMQQVRSFADAGGTILFGTDVDFIDHTDTRREFELMASAGLDWRAILASLTIAPAKRFGQDSRKGRVATGLEADLVVLAADPAQDAAAFSAVYMTIRQGRVIHRIDAATGVDAGATVTRSSEKPREAP